MKKLTAGIFATLLAVVSVDGAYAAIASSGYVDDKVGEVQTAVTAVEGNVSTLKTTVGEHTTQIAGKADKATTLGGYGITDAYTSAQGTALEGRVSAVEAPKAQVAADVPGPVSGGTVYAAIQGVSGDVSGVTSDVGTLKTDMAQAKEDISALETASATHATKTELTDGLATKQDKLSQTGSASQPVYVNAQGVVTAGNTIPSVTTNIATGQTAAAQAGAVADALAAKADAADLDAYVTETEAEAAYAVKALEDQVGTVSKENMGTTNATTVVGGVKEAIDAAKAADTKADNAATAASTAQGAANAAQGDVDALEAVVNHETTGLAAAHDAIDAVEGRVTTAEGEIDTIQGQISNMATSETVTSLTNRVTTAEGDIDDLEAAVNDAESGLAATNAIADQALANAATAQSAAETAQATADAKQDKLTGTIGGSMQPVYLNNGAITAGATLGTLATKSTVTNSEVADNALAQSKINGLATALAAKLTTPPTTQKGEDGLYVLTYDGTDFQWEDIARTVTE